VELGGVPPATENVIDPCRTGFQGGRVIGEELVQSSQGTTAVCSVQLPPHFGSTFDKPDSGWKKGRRGVLKKGRGRESKKTVFYPGKWPRKTRRWGGAGSQKNESKRGIDKSLLSHLTRSLGEKTSDLNSNKKVDRTQKWGGGEGSEASRDTRADAKPWGAQQKASPKEALEKAGNGERGSKGSWNSAIKDERELPGKKT